MIHGIFKEGSRIGNVFRTIAENATLNDRRHQANLQLNQLLKDPDANQAIKNMLKATLLVTLQTPRPDRNHPHDLAQIICQAAIHNQLTILNEPLTETMVDGQPTVRVSSQSKILSSPYLPIQDPNGFIQIEVFRETTDVIAFYLKPDGHLSTYASTTMDQQQLSSPNIVFTLSHSSLYNLDRPQNPDRTWVNATLSPLGIDWLKIYLQGIRPLPTE